LELKEKPRDENEKSEVVENLVRENVVGEREVQSEKEGDVYSQNVFE